MLERQVHRGLMTPIGSSGTVNQSLIKLGRVLREEEVLHGA